MKHLRRATVCGAAAALALAAAAVIDVLAAPSGWLALDGSIRFVPGGSSSVDWANSGLGGPTATCPGGSVDLGGTGGIFNCGRAGAGGAPPTAPTLTPNAAADRSIISADFIVDPIAGDITACGSGDPSTLGGTNGDALNTYAISTGNPPAKDDLSNVYAVSHTRSDTGHPELYFAAERLVNNGDSHIDFEFLQSVVTRTAACGGTFTGHRTEGDLLVAVDYTNGGALASTTVYQWHCTPLPNPQPPDGTTCDPGSGAVYEAIAIPAAITIAVNASDIPCGGWICRNSGGVTATVLSNDFVEGGIDLQGIGFIGCFNTFLPHTRTSAPFSAQLKDFAGPVSLRSCRDPLITSTSSPSGRTVGPGASASDTVLVGNGGAGATPTGTVNFFLCGPAQVSASGCTSGGTAVGSVKTLAAGSATSDPTTATTAPGRYCWRAEYTPDPAATGVFAPASGTDATTECFSVAVPSLPNTGIPSLKQVPQGVPVAPLAGAAVVFLAARFRKSRSIAAIVVAGLVANATPSAPVPGSGNPDSAVQLHSRPATSAVPAPLRLSTEKATEMAWRLVVPRVGLDALILPVGRDADGAMAAPATLDDVGWFDQGPLPGHSGDAVIDGHFGLPGQPAVFGNLGRLQLGDGIEVVAPDGGRVAFRVVSVTTVQASAVVPGLFSRAGPARLSLITCAGAWENSLHSYTDRLIVEAVAT